jgi:hypothetical protein
VVNSTSRGNPNVRYVARIGILLLILESLKISHMSCVKGYFSRLDKFGEMVAFGSGVVSELQFVETVCHAPIESDF